MELEPGEFSLREALENGLTMIRERASNHGIALCSSVEPTLDVVEADERKVKQIIFNLLSNAVKFTPDGGQVDVSARVVDGGVQVAVRDTGVGIAPEDQAHVFEEFRQAGQPSPRQQEGTGLGLALVRRFVELHGGRDHARERGSASAAPSPSPCRTPSPVWPPSASSRHRLAADCFVDDRLLTHRPGSTESGDSRPFWSSRTIRRSVDLLKLYLTPQTSMSLSLGTGRPAWSLLAACGRPASSSTSCLPQLDGWDVLARAKEDLALQDTPIVVVSMLDERGKGFALGADDYLLKPINAEALLATIRRLVQTSRRPATLLAVDDDPLAIELMRVSLQPEGYTVLTASGGVEAIEMARGITPDLIILDLLMPDMNGFAVVETLRADQSTSEIPIVVLTSKTMTARDKSRLNGRISHLASKSSFDRAAFLALVQGLCPVRA